MDIETSVYYVHLMRLIAQEDYIKKAGTVSSSLPITSCYCTIYDCCSLLIGALRCLICNEKENAHTRVIKDMGYQFYKNSLEINVYLVCLKLPTNMIVSI